MYDHPRIFHLPYSSNFSTTMTWQSSEQQRTHERAISLKSPFIVIQMLGTFAVVRDGKRLNLSEYGSRKTRDLLRWLAERRGRPIPDDVLVQALWPDVPMERALRRLRVRMSEVRRLLACGKDVTLVERTDGGYRLNTLPDRL